jgi:hypothetical protein
LTSSYTGKEVAVSRAASSVLDYMTAKGQKAKEQKAKAELTEPPSRFYYLMSDEEYDQSVATNKDEAVRWLGSVNLHHASMKSVVDKMVTDHQVSEAEVLEALKELNVREWWPE